MVKSTLVNPRKSAQRELVEEMGIRVCIGKNLPTSTHHYSTFSVTLHPFVCAIESGEITLHEHAAIAWLTPEQLQTLEWAEADLPVIEMYLNTFESYA